MKEIVLPSGAKLKLAPAPFLEAKALYQAFASEAKELEITPTQEIDVNLYKDIFCTALSSPEIEEKLWPCLARCLYNGEKITGETFEPVAARDDYLTVMYEVARENVHPFVKSLYAQYQGILSEMLRSTPE